jgi:two-component system NtrC family sensor kinase
METMILKSKPSKQPLARQLLIGFSISLATVGLTTLGINYSLIRVKLGQELQQRAQSITQGVGFSTEGLLELENTTIVKRVVQNYATLPTVVEVAIVSPDGKTLARSGPELQNQPYASIHPELAQVLEQSSQTGSETTIRTTVDGKPVLVAILPFSSTLFGQADRRGLTIAMLDVEEMQQQAWQAFSTSTLTLLVGMAGILGLMAALMQRILLQPLHRLNTAITQSESIDHFVMPDKLPNNEIQFLAHTIQAASTRVAAYQKLEAEVIQRQQAEAALLESEAQLRQQTQDLEQALQELQQAQTQIVQSEKMSSLGNLVAGVAHEINNPVNFIHGNLTHVQEYAEGLMNFVQLYQKHYPNPVVEIQTEAEELDLEFIQEDLPKILDSMKIGTDRIRRIVLSLRNFSRTDESELKTVDIHEGIDSTLLILQYRLKDKPEHPAIQVIKDYGELPLVECYPGQLNQVFMNILANAIDALEESNQGRSFESLKQQPNQITIKTRINEKTQSVFIQIKDNGIGIPDAVKQKIFDHLFTTKGIGKGTGLGLSISRQIILEKHNGNINYISSPGQGTEFTIEIPTQQHAYQSTIA